MKKLVIIFISILFIASCTSEWNPYTNKNLYRFSNENFAYITNLKSNVSSLNTDSIASPHKLEIVGNHLIIADTKGSHPIHSFNLITKEYKKPLNFGEGPSEVMIPSWLSTTNDSSLLIFDFAQRKILNYRIDSLFNKTATLERRIKEQNLIGSPTIIGNKVYHLLEGSGQNRLYSINLETEEEINYGNLLTKKTATTTEIVHAQACQAVMTYFDGELYISYGLTPLIDIFDCEHKTWKSLKGPEDFIPIYGEVNIEGTPLFAHKRGKTLYAFIDVAATKKFIYFLYQGEEQTKTLADKHIKSAHNVYVLNQKGEFVKHYKLDKSVTYFTVYKDSIIYGINHEFAPELIEYKLK